jgi:HK97 gp10 family phage protein
VTRWRAGDRERLKRRFERLPGLTQAYVRDALAQGADEITAMQKRLAPRDDGPLQEAISWAWRRKASLGALMTIVIRAGNAKVRYAHLVEYGTRPHKQGGIFKGTMHPGTSPQPFFWPSYRALKKRVTARIRRAFKKAVRDSGS